VFKNVRASFLPSFSHFLLLIKNGFALISKHIIELDNRLNIQMAVDNVQAKETPHVLNPYNVKTASGIFLLGLFLFVYHFAMRWLSMLDGETFAYGPLFLLNMYVGEGRRAFCGKEQYFFYLECTREIFCCVHYDEFCCWNCSVVLRVHRRNCVNSKKGVESMKLNWRLSCSKQSPETETFC